MIKSVKILGIRCVACNADACVCRNRVSRAANQNTWRGSYIRSSVKALVCDLAQLDLDKSLPGGCSLLGK